jgi:hypothetical protein
MSLGRSSRANPPSRYAAPATCNLRTSKSAQLMVHLYQPPNTSVEHAHPPDNHIGICLTPLSIIEQIKPQFQRSDLINEVVRARYLLCKRSESLFYFQINPLQTKMGGQLVTISPDVFYRCLTNCIKHSFTPLTKVTMITKEWCATVTVPTRRHIAQQLVTNS